MHHLIIGAGPAGVHPLPSSPRKRSGVQGKNGMDEKRTETANGCQERRAEGLVYALPFPVIPATSLVIPAKAGIHC